jgi:hypothetical protein
MIQNESNICNIDDTSKIDSKYDNVRIASSLVWGRVVATSLAMARRRDFKNQSMRSFSPSGNGSSTIATHEYDPLCGWKWFGNT